MQMVSRHYLPLINAYFLKILLLLLLLLILLLLLSQKYPLGEFTVKLLYCTIHYMPLATFNTSQPNSTKIYQQTGKHQFATIHYVVTPFFAKFPVELALFAHQFSTQFLSSPPPSWKQASLHGRSIQERGLDFCPV